MHQGAQMSAIIATYSEGHPKHGEIIDWDRSPWWTAGGQYTDPTFAFCLFDLAPDEVPTKIIRMSNISTQSFDTCDGLVFCDRVYTDCDIETEKV